MKTKLLSLFILIPLLTVAQAPISAYYGSQDMEYETVESAVAIDLSPGAALTWNFDQLTVTGNMSYTTTAPTAGELVTYPNSTSVVTASNGSTTAQLYLSSPTGVTSIAGAANDSFVLNYAANNGAIGAFPLSYGYSNSDPTAGTFDYDTYSGTFTGTIATTIDAYGTLNTYDGSGAFAATRLKTVENISLFYGIFGNVGSVTITTYHFYNDAAAAYDHPYFKSTNTVISVPLLSINENITVLERLINPDLGTGEANKTSFTMAPNPANNFLTLQLHDGQLLRSVNINDINGRKVLQSENGEHTVDISNLARGMYLVTVTTDTGTATKKLLKN